MSKSEMEKELNKAYEALNDEFELKKLRLENNELKQQLVNTEAQNKRVLEKLELIVSDNQDLQKRLAEKEHSIGILNQHITDKSIEVESLSDEISSLEQHLTHYQCEVFNLKEQLAELKGTLILQENYFADIKSFNNKRDYAKPIFGQMQEYLNHYKVKDKFKVFCSNCGRWEEYEFKDITFDEMRYDIYIQCKNCPRSLNTNYFPEQAVFFYKFIADLGALQRMQDYSLIESYKAQIDMLEAKLKEQGSEQSSQKTETASKV